jgi:hypothetical protein
VEEAPAGVGTGVVELGIATFYWNYCLTYPFNV